MKPAIIIGLLLTMCSFGKEPLFLLHEIDRQPTESIMVMDFDRDGRLDVGSGAFWYKAPDWTRTEYLNPPTPGKRFLHNHGDAGDYDPIHINYYTIETGSEPKFTRYPLAFNSIVALGLPCEIVDLDGDGDQNIVLAGGTGQYWFENLLINKVPNKQRDNLTDRFPSRL